MGDVYLAQDSKLDRRVALKILRENLSPENQVRQRLLREARAVAKLDHPNICAIYEISETAEYSFIVMQYIEGETLAEILAQKSLSIEKSIDLAIQIADALAEAHSRQIIHRDIKPSNIAVNDKGQVKVLDFGLAKFIETETTEEPAKKLSSSGAIMGTVPFMSPEQLCGKPLDARTDIFSFGAVFYEMLGGISPFQHDSNAEAISAILNDDPDWTIIPPQLRPILQKSLMKDKKERYQTAQDLAQDLRIVGTVSAQTDDFLSPNESAEQKTSTPLYYFWKSLDDDITPQTKPITNEQKTKFKKLNLNYFAIVFGSFVIFSIAAILIFGRFSTNTDSHLFDDLRPVQLVSWKTGASTIYSDYRASHDGRMIAYSTQDGENETVIVKQINGGADIPVIKNEWRNRRPDLVV